MREFLATSLYRLVVSSGMVLSCAGLAQAAEPPYPVRPIRIIVASAPSSGPDIVARLLARRLTETWGQQVVVDDRAGAGGNVGAEIAARANPDGYTLLMATASQAIAVGLYGKLNYDLLRDFAPVSLVASTPYLLVTPASLAAGSVKDLIALAKSKPGELHYGSGGAGSPPHLCAEIFNTKAGIKTTHVPYKGITPALTDLTGGQIQFAFSVVPAALPLVRGGKLRALAISGAKRSPLVPELPTVGETLPGFEVVGWYGVLAPTGTAPAIVNRWNQEAVRTLKTAEMEERLQALGADGIGTSPQQFSAFLKSEVTKWREAVKASGAKAD